MANAKLRRIDTSKVLTPFELELLNWNFWAIENALNSVGASTPGGGTVIPPVSDHHLLSNLTTFDDHTQYLYLAGRSPGQEIEALSNSDVVLSIDKNNFNSSIGLRIKVNNTPTSEVTALQFQTRDGLKTPVRWDGDGHLTINDDSTYSSPGATGTLLTLFGRRDGTAAQGDIIALYSMPSSIQAFGVNQSGFISLYNRDLIGAAGISPHSFPLRFGQYVVSSVAKGVSFELNNNPLNLLNIDFSALTAARILTVRDLAGTIALLSDVSGSTSLFSERANQNITAASQAVVVTDGLVVTPVTPNNNYTLTSVPTIANGRDGQIAIIQNLGSFILTLQDMGTLAGSNLRLQSTTRALPAFRGMLELVFSTALGGWVETYFSQPLSFTPSISNFTIDGSSAATREVAAASTPDATPSFVITYIGVPSAASIDIDAGGGEIVGSDYPITVPTPFTTLNSGTTPPSKAFNRGTSVAQVRTFTVTATASGTAGLTRTCTATYLNRRYAGPNSQATILSSAQILALDNTANGTSDLSNSQFSSFVVTTAAGEFIWFAHRSALSAVTFMSVQSEIAGFTDMGTLSHTNDFGFVETFRAYKTTNTNFGASKTLTTSSSRPTNRIYMGPAANGTATILTSEILALDDTANGTSRLGSTVGASYVVTISGGGNYLWFCHPSAIPDLATIKDNSTGFAVSGSYRNNISHTNDMGFTETYRCWRSDNPGIFPSGGTVVVT